jgi:hypothetical protein
VRTTYSADPNEACWGLDEGPVYVRNRDGSAEWRWWQRTRVVRGDELAEFTRDLGPLSKFENAVPLGILSLGTDSVGEVWFEADRSRFDDTEMKLRAQVKAESTLIADAVKERQENTERINNRSQLGPYQAKQRNGFDKRAAVEAAQGARHDDS